MYGNYPTSNSSSPQPRSDRKMLIWGLGGAIVILVAALIAVIVVGNSSDTVLASNETSTTTSVTTVTATASPTPSATKVSKKCVEADTTDVHVEMKALDAGIQTTEAGDPLIRKAIEANKIQFASYLAPFAWQDEYERKAPPRWDNFTVKKDGKSCLTEEGIKMRDDLLKRLKSAKVKEGVPIPMDHFNTGIAADGTPVVNTHAGIPQGRIGTLYEFEDGTKFFVDWYCGNASKAEKPRGFVTKPIPVPPQPPQPPVVCVGEHCNPQPPPPPPPPPCPEPCCPPGGCPPPPPPPLCPDGTPVPPSGLCIKNGGGPGSGGPGSGGPGGGQPGGGDTEGQIPAQNGDAPAAYTPIAPPPEEAAPAAPPVVVAPPQQPTPGVSAPLPVADTAPQESDGAVDVTDPALAGTDFG